MSRRILLVEDEPSLVMTLSDRFRAEGYQVEVASDGLIGYERGLSGEHDLLVLDLMLPGKSGLDICRDLRGQGVQTPVLMLTAKAQTFDKVLGLKLGADDYLTKPFEMIELLARVEALLRRSGRELDEHAQMIRFGEVVVDLKRAEVHSGGEVVHLSAQEYRLLCFFLEHPGEVLSRDRLLDEVWGYGSESLSRTVDVHVSGLRAKLEPVSSKPRHIVTVHGLGYRFDG